MERKIDRAKLLPAPAPSECSAPENGARSATQHRAERVASTRPDPSGLLPVLAGTAGYAALAALCLALSRFDSALASVWLPNGFAVALLLLAGRRAGWPAYAGIALASVGAHLWAGNTAAAALVFSAANVAEIALVTSLIRRACGPRPDITDLAHLERFLQIGGILGPLASTLIAAAMLGDSPGAIAIGACSWFLAASMGMILIVPAALLVADIRHRRAYRARAPLAERIMLLLGGAVAVGLVFAQSVYPLLFLVPPITLLVAFRLGAMGTAIFVPVIAALASAMTILGLGPIAQYAPSTLGQTFLVQAFIAVNFVTGLPIAAILAGRIQLTQELTQGRREVALLTEHITDAVLRVDREGVCTYASPSVFDVLGHEPSAFVGQPVTRRVHTDTHHRISEVLERLLCGVSVKERVTYRRLLDSEAGLPVFIEADCAAVIDPETGAHEGIVMSARDVTDRVELELLLTRARAAAEHATQAKSEFLANMSHEIRTPMNGVLGFAELMLQGDLDAENRRHTEMIVQSGRSMMLLLNDILDLSKIEAGQFSVSREPVDLLATIAECGMLYRPKAEGKGLELVFDQPGARSANAEPWVIGDALRLRQIILNLVGNAVKFTEQGRVEIRCHTEAERFHIDVIDTGIGISPDRLGSIFAPFTQGESDTARRFGGTGLGLTISRRLAELLGGTIEVRSTPGEGSTFRLSMPAIYTQAVQCPAAEPAPIAPADFPQRSRILLVEDHDVNRLLGIEMLERCGQSVAIAQDGNEAIAMVIDAAMRGTLFDLVLMDIQMPGCDGYAATRAIRAEGIGPDMLPIIALTANAFADDIEAARAAGMQGHLAKPLVFAELARALQRWLPTRIVESDRDEGRRDRAVHMGPMRRASDKQAHAVQAGLAARAPQPAPVPIPNDPAARPEVPRIPRPTYSPALIERWTTRRAEAVEAVREAPAAGTLGDPAAPPEHRERLIRLVHKLAGTAAIFGEGELGDQAAIFERGLREPMPGDVLESLAFNLLSVADDPEDSLAQAG